MKKKYPRQISYLKTGIIHFLVLLLLSSVLNKGYAQQSILWSKEMQAILKPSSTEGWLEFKDETNINPATLFSEYKNLFIPGINEEMRLVKTENDNIGMVHYSYQQYYKGIKIKGAEFNVHAKDGRAVSANGIIVTNISRSVTVSVSEEDALREALKNIPSRKYIWLNEREEKRLKEREKNNDATYYPQGELTLVKPKNEKTATASNLILSWKFDISVENGFSKTVFIDAETGSTVNTIALDFHCVLGTGATTWNGTQQVWTKTSGSNYIIYEDCGTPEFRIRNANGETDLSNVTEFTDANNIWTSAAQQPQIQTYIGLRTAFLYYFNTFGRNSYDNAGALIEGYNNMWFVSSDTTQPDYPNNASWYGTSHFIGFGPGSTSSPTDDWNTDDIAGHEFTHGVTQFEADLDYQDESGALNESFSDIFGEMIEKMLEGSIDWLEAADRSTGYIRNLSNPNDNGQPDTYNGDFWYTGPNDEGGVHTNSGVQNYCFYLLSVGGSGTNDNGAAYSVTGIGADAAAAIAYRALTVYLNSGSDYIDSRKAWVHSAVDLYGGCSNEAIQTGYAWRAVGVEAQSAQYINNVCGTYPSGSSVTFQAIHILGGSSSCSNIITPSSFSVAYSSVDMVVLYPGFIAQSGSHFVAYLEPCAITLYKTPTPFVADIPLGQEITEKLNDSGNSDKLSLEASPNPFSEQLILRYNLANAGKIRINMYDLPGNKVMEEQLMVGTSGINNFTIYTKDLTQGIYFVEVAGPNLTVTKKVIKVE